MRDTSSPGETTSSLHPWLWRWMSPLTKLAGRWQTWRQPSSLLAFPSSHSSPAWATPSPHTAAGGGGVEADEGASELEQEETASPSASSHRADEPQLEGYGFVIAPLY